MKIYTKTGDGGETSLYGGLRVGKDDARISAIGSVDEANSAVGLARSFCLDRHVDIVLARIQSDLFVLGADLAAPLENKNALRTGAEMVKTLEGSIDKADAYLPPLKTFILPAGSKLSSALHFVRSVVRRAERETVALSKVEDVNPHAIGYLNRLSDLLFVLARKANKDAGFREEAWVAEEKKRKHLHELL